MSEKISIAAHRLEKEITSRVSLDFQQFHGALGSDQYPKQSKGFIKAERDARARHSERGF